MQNPADIRKYAFDLTQVFAQSRGLVPTPTPMKALIDGNITVPDLERRLKLAGLEMYPDATGANFIRTIEAGDIHRGLVRAERDLEELERRQYRREVTRYSPYEPPETRDVRVPDADEQYDDDRAESDR